MREPPRKLSVKDDTPDVFNVEIHLDGVKQEHVIDYDQESGYVTRYVQGEDGKLVIDPEKDTFKTERVPGEVLIYWINPPKD